MPRGLSLDELVEYFDTHDMGEHEEDLPEVHFDVNLQRRTHLIAIDEEIKDKLTAIAEREQTPVETLVNSWLKEKISVYSEKV